MTTPPASAIAQASQTPAQPAAPLTQQEQVTHYVDLYKQAVAVQMHFNDIEWRIRGLALTVATFALGAAGVAAKDGTTIGVVSLGSLVLLLGLLLWYAFYFVDRVWYHPLLKAAVVTGTEIENEIKAALPKATMTSTITARSEYQPKGLVRLLSGKKVMHSDDKLGWFYAIGAVTLASAAVALQVGSWLTDATDETSAPPPSPVPSVSTSPSPSPSPTPSQTASMTTTGP